MKKIIYTLLSMFTLAVTLNSCVEDTNYETPQIDCEEPTLTGSEVSIETILNQWISTNDTDESGVVEYFETENPVKYDANYANYITGYVISNDNTGNFYKELYIQNDPVNPTASIKVSIDVSSLYTKYDIGRKVYIYLHDLAINRDRGEMVIGEMIDNSLGNIRENRAKENIFRNCEAVDVAPIILDSPIDANDDYLGMLIQFDNMQFYLDLMGETFVDPYDSYDSHRMLTSCDDNSEIRLETSTYASFKDDLLPSMKGSVQGILARDYGDDFYVLRVNGIDAFSFDGARCDPETLDCGLAATQGTSNLFSDNFETESTGSLISGSGWTNYIQEGTEGWEAYTSSGSNPSIGISARVGSYSSGDASSIAWLITPPIDFDTQEGETFVFKTSNSYADGSNLELLYSTDWDGDEANISSATWGILPAAYLVQDGDSYGSWFDSGIVDLSCAEGSMYIAFKYSGSGNADFDGTYELDEISIDF